MYAIPLENAAGGGAVYAVANAVRLDGDGYVYGGAMPTHGVALDADGYPSHCGDGQLNYDETAVDCGGLCVGCEGGQKCVGNNDCESGVCQADSTCAAVVAGDGDAADVGDAAGDAAGDGAAVESDAAGVPEHCSDGKLDDRETDIDCGGLCAKVIRLSAGAASSST